MFFLGMGGFVLFFLALILFINVFIYFKSPEFMIGAIFIMGIVLSGSISVLLFETKRARDQLNEEREKRRVAFSNKAPQLIEETNFEGIPFSVTETTTKKFTR